MDRVAVNSSTIREIGYDEKTLTLEILFTSGGIYQYADCKPETYKAFMASSSKGHDFAIHIKPNHACTVVFKPEPKGEEKCRPT